MITVSRVLPIERPKNDKKHEDDAKKKKVKSNSFDFKKRLDAEIERLNNEGLH